MNFGNILMKAWKIIWKHKILWVFGILAGCSTRYMRGGAGGGGGGGGSASNASMSFSNSPAIENFFESLSNITVIVWIVIAIGIIAGIFILSILFLMAGTLGVSAVIKGTGLAQEAEPDAKPLSLKTIFNAVKPYFWKVLLLDVGYSIAGFILVLVFFIPMIIFTVCTCGLIWLLAIPIGWLVHVMLTFTTIAIIEEDKSIFDAIARAWHVITKNLGQVILMSLILGIGQFILMIVLAAPLLLTVVPVVINLIVTGGDAVGAGLIISGILFLVLLPLVILLGGGLRAYVLTSWTLTYHQLINKEELEPAVLTEEEVDEDLQ
jgi:hypothetical protein